MSNTITPCPDWANLDPSIVVDNIRETTLFDADMIEAMLKFAIESAARAARTAPAEQAEPVAEMKGSYLYPLKSIPSGTKLYTAPDALQAEVSKNKLLRAQLETVRLQRDKELKEKCEALNELERLREQVERLKATLYHLSDVWSINADEHKEYARSGEAEALRGASRELRNALRIAEPEVKS
ncbi:hypothetical protein [Pseudomonas luteola]|uniref:Uncharacterized protein n=1 Tax=Pseudomonas luteola TaxID=47886 RepID=A0ABS0MUR2_PSELU|nr:hypothetical protein [Pseudomonas luteola]MBH3440485.1 hypothetical protein [Pseudomonas luteola]